MQLSSKWPKQGLNWYLVVLISEIKKLSVLLLSSYPPWRVSLSLLSCGSTEMQCSGALSLLPLLCHVFKCFLGQDLEFLRAYVS